ncbi:GNAT family N-acetyltransferase [Clostridium neuense]|uniref:GNAT family N-acetyltransferase n=1 Tax=Clostridium neuense TaxID=1728934 RepID=A0ABW8TJL1_9CLOT
MCNIRVANLQDESQLINLVKVGLNSEKIKKTAKEVVEDFFNDTKYEIFVIEDSNSLKGFGSLEFKRAPGEDEIAELVMMNVNDDLKEKGYQNKLINYIEKYARETGVKEIYLRPWKFR